ncbi:MAG TPA: cation:proton antiporter [Casimicrobiaceae bacterium]|nr:cation:proton antiporter [Casimicrobiaceae bacterium]
MPNTLLLILLLLAASVVAVAICRSVRLPPILGYLLVGVILGPHALAIVPNDETTRELAEFGIVFLLFSIGLEFSLPQLRAMRRAVFGLGLAQVAITTIAGTIALQLLGFGWRAGIVLGGALAMSSTAIVSKMLAERGEFGTAHGRDVMGILLFQDLAVVLFLILIPSLALPGLDTGRALAGAVLKAAIALSLILFFGQRPMHAWFMLVARQRSSELFALNVLLVTLGMAAITQFFGLSLALGAFLAGMLISETEFRYQVEDDIKPFRDVLLGLFFITIGMMLDLHIDDVVAGEALLLLIFPVGAKLVLVVVLARVFGAPPATALRTGFYLAQAGEFALVMLALATGHRFISPRFEQAVLAAMILSMLLAPLMIQHAERFVRKFTANDWLARAAELTQAAATSMARQDHVIVAGYGRSGQNLTRLLEREDIGYVALDSDPARVREAADGRTVIYGDASRREMLVAAGLAKARAVVISFDDTPVALKILHHVQQLQPTVPVIVRTRDDAEIGKLIAAGATEVVPEVLEGSLMLASHSLLVLGIPLVRVLARIREVREARYALFRGFFHGTTDFAADDNVEPRLHTVHLSERARAVGRSLSEVEVGTRVEVTGIRRHGARSVRPGPDWRFEPGDTVVLLGRPVDLARAEKRLLEEA